MDKMDGPMTWPGCRTKLVRAEPKTFDDMLTESAKRMLDSGDLVTRGDLLMARQTIRQQATRIAELEARQVPELGSGIVNECGWRFIEAMPCPLPGGVFNNLKPALYEALKLYHATVLAVPSPADSGEVKP